VAYSAGTAFVQVNPSLKGFHQQIRAELAGMRDTVTVKVVPQYDRGSFANAPRVPDQAVKVRAEVDTRSWVDASNAVALFTRNLAVPVGVIGAAAAIPTLLDIVNAAGAASQSLLLLPAAGAAAAAVMGTVRVATSGLGDAFKQVFAADRNPEKLAEALAHLSPNARAAVVEVDKMRPALDSLRVDVQDTAFRNLSTTVGQLGRTYLPVVREGMTGVAAEGNVAVQSVAAFAREAQTVSTVQSVFTVTATVVRQLSPALVNVLAVIRDIVAEGTHYLPGVANGFVNITARVREFIAEARASGQLGQWMSNGIIATQLLGQTFMALGSTIFGVFRAARTDTDGFLVGVRNAAVELSQFVNSVQGQNALSEFFTNLRTVAVALLPLLGLVGAAAVGMVNSLGPILPSVVAALVAVLTAAQPLLDVFTTLALAVIPPLAAAIQFLAPVLGPVVAAMVAASVASRAWAVAQGVATAATSLYNTAIVAGRVVQLAWTLATNAGARALTLWAAQQWLVNAAMAANPIGIVVVALGALVAAIVLAYNHSETFRAIVSAAWAGIQSAAATAWSFLQGVFSALGAAVTAVGAFFTNLWRTYVEPAWQGIVTVAQWALAILLAAVLIPIQIALNATGAFFNVLRDIAVAAWRTISEEAQIWWTFLKGIFDAVVNFLGPIFTPVWNGFRDMVVAVWNFLTTRITNWWNAEVLPIWNTVIGFLGGIFTQAFEGWRILVTGVYDFLRDRLFAWWNGEVLPTWNAVVGFLASIFGPAFNTARDVVVASWNTMRDAMNTVWTFVRDNIWQPLVTFITETIPNGFQTGVDAVGRLWDGIRAALRDPLQAAIDIVWNNGTVKVWGMVTSLVGLDNSLQPYNLPALAGGGPVTRPTVALVGEAGPEYVLSNKAVRNMGGMGSVDLMHRSAARGSPRSTVRAMNSGQYVEGADHDAGGYSNVGFGGVRPHVAQAGHYLGQKFGIGTIGGVGARANASDHPGGLALDFMTGGENGTQLADFVSSPANWNHFAIKYVIWRQRIRNGPGAGWSPMADRGSPTANHMDHVHVSFTGTPGQGAMDGGGGGPSILELLTQAWQTVTDAVGRLGSIGGGPWGEAAGGFMRKTVDTVWDYVSGLAATVASNVVGSVVGFVTGGNVGATLSAAATARGWGGTELSALNEIIRRESGGSLTAQNPTSTASGLFQMINGTWRGYGGSTATAAQASAAEQIRVGFNYIGSRYGSPSAALRFWDANGYYDAGGMASGRGIMLKNVLAPERTLSPRQTTAFEQLVATISRGRGSVTTDRYGRGMREGVGAEGADGPLIGSLTVPVPEGAGIQQTLDSVFTRARHEVRRGRYSRP
jgi:hypothetical protein